MERQNFTLAVNDFNYVLGQGVFNQETVDKTLDDIIHYLKTVRQLKNKVYLVGNGGSAAVAGHICIDLINVNKIHAQVLHDAPQLSCFSNDYGYEESYSRQLDIIAQAGDMLIAISSSGQSQNIINAVSIAQKKEMHILTLTGFKSDNTIRQSGHWNYWLESTDYGQVEIGHLFLLHYLCKQLG